MIHFKIKNKVSSNRKTKKPRPSGGRKRVPSRSWGMIWNIIINISDMAFNFSCSRLTFNLSVWVYLQRNRSIIFHLKTKEHLEFRVLLHFQFASLPISVEYTVKLVWITPQWVSLEHATSRCGVREVGWVGNARNMLFWQIDSIKGFVNYTFVGSGGLINSHFQIPLTMKFYLYSNEN